MLFSFLEYRQTHFPELLLLKKKRSFFDILNKTECFLDQKYKVLKKSKKSGFWFWSKNGHFSYFFLDNIGQENVFYDILEQKNAFLGYKNKKIKKSKKLTFFQRG